MSNPSSSKDSLNAATLEWVERFAPYGVIATDRELRIRSWNRWMQVHSGLSADQTIGRKLTELYPDLISRRLISHFDRALAGEVSVLSTALHGYLLPLPPLVRGEFEQMKQTARIAPLVSNDQIHGTIVVIEDVTQREWHAEILRRQHMRDEILSWALQHLLKTENPRKVSRELFCKIAEHLDFDSYLLYLLDPTDPNFQLYDAGGLSPETEHLVASFAVDSLPWVPTAREEPSLVRDYQQIQKDPKSSIGQSLGFHAYIVLPLITGPAILGFLIFATRSRDSISRLEAELLETLAQYLSVALNREKTDRELRDAQKKLSQHAHELEKNVAERTASLKQIIAELQTFSSTVAHDLRAPIRALNGYCEVLLEDFAGKLPAEANAVVERLRNSAIRMDSLTRDLLEFSKISRQDIKLEVVSLEEVVEDGLFGTDSKVTAAVQIVRPLHQVLAHRTLVAQCVTNLIENAMKFVRPETRQKIIVRTELVDASEPGDTFDTRVFTPSRYSLTEIPTKPASTRVRLWFEDQGIGVPADAREKIFGIFERGVNADQYEGTGIGLAIVARAMERMGGNCGVESDPGEGSRFWLEFLTPAIPVTANER